MQSKTRAIVMVVIMGLMVGCSTGSVTKEEGDTLMKSAQVSRQEWNKIDPQFEAFAKKGYGYAFFPEITKGGLLVGAAHGRGVVYEKGQQIGYATLDAIKRLPAERGIDPGIGRASGRTSGLQRAHCVRESSGDGQIQTKRD